MLQTHTIIISSVSCLLMGIYVMKKAQPQTKKDLLFVGAVAVIFLSTFLAFSSIKSKPIQEAQQKDTSDSLTIIPIGDTWMVF